ncbi:DUF4381 domain-containing protein [Thiorhodococcus minor]|uniref:DUF4381 domain-containing protein n=1 Tax=Thiorhodococcus minor TaxID=57489 RepID=A0A6M0JYK5_9GAMM|nr:DUF4381 domain-containing protein [Thiorhodococcus minor]NEV62586.1 DUF4381 domain-containing protein [Thiorhodococcus minor]
MDPILSPLQQAPQLRDIRDISSIPWWPPAPGWWLILGAVLLIGYAIWRWRTPLSLRVPIPGITLGTWRWDAAAALRDLRRRAQGGQDPKATASELSELLRRIAMARLGRPACAGLTGPAWLEWLQAQDPNGFAWRERGQPLLVAPYAPPGVTAQDLMALIEAAEGWVSAREPKRRRWRRWRSRSASAPAGGGHV